MTRIVSFLVAGLLMTAQVWIAYFAALPVMLGRSIWAGACILA